MVFIARNSSKQDHTWIYFDNVGIHGRNPCFDPWAKPVFLSQNVVKLHITWILCRFPKRLKEPYTKLPELLRGEMPLGYIMGRGSV